ncbi:hypothetical protein HMPREF1145_1747 [Oribacterium parvum ACB8]|nr:hypothetical protein HMPREF1145_1747 [Oribacterium parvum ACB8]
MMVDLWIFMIFPFLIFFIQYHKAEKRYRKCYFHILTILFYPYYHNIEL